MNDYSIVIHVQAEDSMIAEDWIDWLLEQHFGFSEDNTLKCNGYRITDATGVEMHSRVFDYFDKKETGLNADT